MDYAKQSQLALKTAREYISKRIAPMAAKNDDKEKIETAIFSEMGEIGLFGIPYSPKYDGSGFSYSLYYRFIRELASICASTAMTTVVQSTLVSEPIYQHGSIEQKKKYLPQLFRGKRIGAFALTETNAGSDIGSITTTAEEKEDCYILNGSKAYITNANIADTFVVAARTAPLNGVMGISLFLLDNTMQGIERSGRSEKKLGMRASDTGSLFFNNVSIPKKSLLGRKNFGIQILHKTLCNARIGMAAIAIGISQGALAHCLEYAKQRKQFGRYIYNFQSVANMLVNMELKINASLLMLQHAVNLKDTGIDVTSIAAQVKLFASEMAMEITKDAIQIYGSNGYSREFPLERFFRDAKLTEIGDGTSEILKGVIAQSIVKHGPLIRLGEGAV